MHKGKINLDGRKLALQSADLGISGFRLAYNEQNSFSFLACYLVKQDRIQVAEGGGWALLEVIGKG